MWDDIETSPFGIRITHATSYNILDLDIDDDLDLLQYCLLQGAVTLMEAPSERNQARANRATDLIASIELACQRKKDLQLRFK